MIDAIQKIFSPKILNRALGQFGSISAKYFFLLALMGMGVVALIVLIRKAMKKETYLSDILTGMVLAVYVSLILQLTLICRESGSRIGFELDVFNGLTGQGNDFQWLMMALAVLNSMMFMPYGFVISMFSFVNEQKIGIQCLITLLLSFGFSISIECVQLITQRGYYETQDLFFNTVGGALGWLIFRSIYRLGNMLLGREGREAE